MSECIGEGCTHPSHGHVLTKEDTEVQYSGVRELVSEAEMKKLTELGDERKTVIEKPSKKSLHMKMRRLGMGKHAGGNAQTLANHSRVPGEIVVGQNKTLAQVRADKKAKSKRKNKMARRSRRANRR